jgi:hypothetical protein
VTTRLIGILQDLDIWCVTRSSISVISSLRSKELLVLLDFVSSSLLREVSQYALLVSSHDILLSLDLSIIRVDLTLVISFLQLPQVSLAL